MRAGLALGSNLGERLANLSAARQQIASLPNAQPPILASSAYETDPVGCEPDAPKFLNAVMEIGYNGDPRELLQQLRRIEAELGRPATHERNVSRTLDLDLLYFGDVEIADRDLQLPHPRMHERRFVLEPLNDIRPDLVLPTHSSDVAALLRGLPDTQPLVRLPSKW